VADIVEEKEKRGRTEGGREGEGRGGEVR